MGGTVAGRTEPRSGIPGRCRPPFRGEIPGQPLGVVFLERGFNTTSKFLRCSQRAEPEVTCFPPPPNFGPRSETVSNYVPINLVDELTLCFWQTSYSEFVLHRKTLLFRPSSVLDCNIFCAPLLMALASVKVPETTTKTITLFPTLFPAITGIEAQPEQYALQECIYATLVTRISLREPDFLFFSSR